MSDYFSCLKRNPSTRLSKAITNVIQNFYPFFFMFHVKSFPRQIFHILAVYIEFSAEKRQISRYFENHKQNWNIKDGTKKNFENHLSTMVKNGRK